MVTVYIYPMSAPASTIEESCRMEFEGVKRSLVLRFPEAVLMDEWTESMPRLIGSTSGLAAAYEIIADMSGGAKEPIRSEAHLFCGVGGSWSVKYRASYAKAVNPSMVGDVIAATPADVPQ